MNNRHRTVTLVAAVATAGALFFAGCGGDSSSATSSNSDPTTTAGAASGVKVTSLDVPETLECGGKTSVDLTVSYAVEGAERQELYVDGRKVDGTDAPTATINTWVHCDTLPHTIDVVGYDSKDRHTTLEKKVTTNL